MFCVVVDVYVFCFGNRGAERVRGTSVRGSDGRANEAKGAYPRDVPEAAEPPSADEPEAAGPPSTMSSVTVLVVTTVSPDSSQVLTVVVVVVLRRFAGRFATARTGGISSGRPDRGP